jgi:hypothetical protein
MFSRELITSILKMNQTDHASKMIIQKSAMLVYAEETYIKPDPLSDEDPTRPAPDGPVPVPEPPSPKIYIKPGAISLPTFTAPQSTSVSATAPLGREGWRKGVNWSARGNKEWDEEEHEDKIYDSQGAAV